MLIYLIGYMGSGKSRYGKAAAKALGYNYLDLDKMIEQKTCLSIDEIFITHGESVFRSIEQDLLTQTMPATPTIMSTGGGTPCNEQNIRLMKSRGRIIYLKLHPTSLALRLLGARDVRPIIRPHLPDPLAFVTQHLAERESWYLQADMVVKGEDLTGQKLASYISTLF